MSISEKLTKIAENEQKVYDAGMDEVINAVTQSGARTHFDYGFLRWGLTDGILKQLPPLKPTSAKLMFGYTNGSRASLKNADMDFSECKTLYQAFYYSGIEEIGVLDASNVISSNGEGLYQMFYANGNSAIKWIDKFIVAEETDRFYLTFQLVKNLEHCIFEGCIAKNGLALDTCTKLDRESLLSVIECLKDYSEDTSGTAYSVKFGNINKPKLTDAEIAAGTQKGWSIVA